jgi:topoisomerase-4 subunit A
MLGRDGRPRSKDLKQAIEEWIAFRFETVTRRTRHRLGEVDRRIHILEGRQKALLNIDKVIRIIRKADDPKADLMAEFDLTEIQADDILEIRLRQLARLEGIRIDNELKSLNTERKGLKRVLGDEQALSDLIVSEIEADAEKFGDARRTQIEAAASPVMVRTVPDEPVTITLSRNGWIRSRQGHGLEASQFTYKGGDSALAVIETRTVHPIVILDTRGRAYTVRASDVPGGRGDGVPVTTLIDLQAGGKVAQAIVGSPESRYLVAGSGGYGFIATFEDMVSRVKAGKAFMTLDEDEAPLRPVSLAEGLDLVATLTAKSKLLVFRLDEMRTMERGRGVMMMRLDDDDRLAAVALANAARVLLRGISRGKETVVAIEGDELARHRLHRARKGYLLARRFKPEGFA